MASLGSEGELGATEGEEALIVHEFDAEDEGHEAQEALLAHSAHKGLEGDAGPGGVGEELAAGERQADTRRRGGNPQDLAPQLR